MEVIMICDTVWDEPPEQVVFKGRHDWPHYVPEPPTCIMEPDGLWQEESGCITCSNCGKVWAFECAGPKENGWVYCPGCASKIMYEDET